jgi:hypothetical protein
MVVVVVPQQTKETYMAQNLSLANVGMSVSITSGAIGVILHIDWIVLSYVAGISLILIVWGFTKLIRGNHVLAKSRKHRDKPD